MTDVDVVETTLYLTLKLDKELLALDVSRVREVLDLCTITRVPRTPRFMKGVINLRGMVIPVIDLRRKFGMPSVEDTIDSRIVVAEIDLEGAETVVGVLTDSVHDVVEIGHDKINAAPETGKRWRREYVKGIGKQGDNFILLLDLDRLFSENALQSITEKQKEETA